MPKKLMPQNREEASTALFAASGVFGWVAIFGCIGLIGGDAHGLVAVWAFLIAITCSGSGMALVTPTAIPQGRRRRVKPMHYAEQYYALAKKFGELGEQAMADDYRAWGDLSKLLVEAYEGRVSDVDLAPVTAEKPAEPPRGPHLIPNTDGGTALGTCSDCGVTIYHEGSHLVKRSGRWRCPNRTEALVRAASKQIFLPRS